MLQFIIFKLITERKLYFLQLNAIIKNTVNFILNVFFMQFHVQKTKDLGCIGFARQ
jgi:hypothetical protein